MSPASLPFAALVPEILDVIELVTGRDSLGAARRTGPPTNTPHPDELLVGITRGCPAQWQVLDDAPMLEREPKRDQAEHDGIVARLVADGTRTQTWTRLGEGLCQADAMETFTSPCPSVRSSGSPECCTRNRVGTPWPARVSVATSHTPSLVSDAGCRTIDGNARLPRGGLRDLPTPHRRLVRSSVSSRRNHDTSGCRAGERRVVVELHRGPPHLSSRRRTRSRARSHQRHTSPQLQALEPSLPHRHAPQPRS